MKKRLTIERSTLIEIGDAIREAESSKEVIPVSDLAKRVAGLHDVGAEREYDRFWDMFQSGGERHNYQYAFAYSWNDEAYNPKYSIVCSANIYAATGLFVDSTITDTKVPIIVCNTRADAMFQDCLNLKRIASLTVESLVRFNNTFRNCRALEELNLYGVVDVSGLDLQHATKLSKVSIERAVAALSATTSGLAVTFSESAVNTAFETALGEADGIASPQWATLVNTKSNWNINLV